MLNNMGGRVERSHVFDKDFPSFVMFLYSSSLHKKAEIVTNDRPRVDCRQNK